MGRKQRHGAHGHWRVGGVPASPCRGPWLWKGRGPAMDDKRTALTRSRAFFWGYAVMMAATVAMFILSLAGKVAAPEATHPIFALGVATPLYGFAIID